MTGKARPPADEAQLLARAGLGLYQASCQAGRAALGAHFVIAYRSALLASAMLGLRPVDHGEFSRMGLEKVEAGLAAGPALVDWWSGMQAEWLRVWEKEVLILARSAAQLSDWTASSTSGTAWAEAAAARARVAALGLVIANTAALAPVLTPFHGRIEKNLERLGRPTSAPSRTGRRRRRVPRTRS